MMVLGAEMSKRRSTPCNSRWRGLLAGVLLVVDPTLLLLRTAAIAHPSSPIGSCSAASRKRDHHGRRGWIKSSNWNSSPGRRRLLSPPTEGPTPPRSGGILRAAVSAQSAPSKEQLSRGGPTRRRRIVRHAATNSGNNNNTRMPPRRRVERPSKSTRTSTTTFTRGRRVHAEAPAADAVARASSDDNEFTRHGRAAAAAAARGPHGTHRPLLLLVPRWRTDATALGLSSMVRLPGTATVAAALLAVGGWCSVATRPSIRRATRFWWTAGPIVAHYRLAQWWMEDVRRANRTTRDRVYGNLHRQYCHPTHQLILDLKGLYAKIGQVLSSRPDFVPVEYVELFSAVQDSLPPWPMERVREILAQSLRTELGIVEDLNDVFEYIDPDALGLASIGQVHAAVLSEHWTFRDTPTTTTRRSGGGWNNSNRNVAVKVMHPGAQDCFKHDFQVFRWLCRLALPSWMGLLDELERRIMTEFDYRNEADMLRLARSNVDRSPYRHRVCVPLPHPTLCTQHVLVMELLRGQKLVDDVQDKLDAALGQPGLAAKLLRQRQHQVASGGANPSSLNDGPQFLPGLESLSLPTKLRLFAIQKRCLRYVDLLVDVHGHQIFVDGAFNADPHPGNVLVLNDGRLGLIDYGQTRRLSDAERLDYARVVVALGEVDSDAAEVSERFRDCGFVARHPGDIDTLAQYAALFFDTDRESRDRGFATPQLYYASLMRANPLLVIPDAAVFIARTSFLFRGMGEVVGSGSPVRTAVRWAKHAQVALDQAEAGAPGAADCAGSTSPPS